MNRPIGVTLLAIGAGLAGLYEIWRALVFMGVVNFTFVGNEVAFPNPQWGQVIWALLLAAIWFWVAVGFWNVRAYAWSFGIFVSIFTLIFGFMAVLFDTTYHGIGVRRLVPGPGDLLLPELPGRPGPLRQDRNGDAHSRAARRV